MTVFPAILGVLQVSETRLTLAVLVSSFPPCLSGTVRGLPVYQQMKVHPLVVLLSPPSVTTPTTAAASSVLEALSWLVSEVPGNSCCVFSDHQ